MQQVRAKKSLGQHFLKDLGVAQRIADTIQSGRVLEIGPGMGVLTQFLLRNNAIDLTAIELDRDSVAYLREWYPELKLIEGDFLKLDLDRLFPEGDFSVIGNYPYNISSQIFFRVLDYRDRIPVCSGMIQKEVAERIASKPGKKAYGILSVLLQAYYDIEYLFTVDEYVSDLDLGEYGSLDRCAYVGNDIYLLGTAAGWQTDRYLDDGAVIDSFPYH